MCIRDSSNPSHPEYGVATIPCPIPNDQYAQCMDLLEALEIGDALKADCKVETVSYTHLDAVNPPQLSAREREKAEKEALRDLLCLLYTSRCV